jgi:hypothetical protein
MRKVFEPDEMELADLGGDTHFVADIQRHVKEMLGERGKRREEIRQEIKALGPRALPGALNAAYVFTVQLKKRDQELLAGLLAELVGENVAAREMLLRAGVLEAPFVPTRKTALMALQQRGDIREEEINRIHERAWHHAYMEGDYQAALPLYEFLVQRKDPQACGEVKMHAKSLFEDNVDIGPSFLDLALRGNPDDTYAILTEVMKAMGSKEPEFGREIEKRVSHEAVVDLLEILRAANYIMETSKGYSHKGIEYLFVGAIAHHLGDHQDVIEESGDLVRRKYTSLYRYWWQGLGRIIGSEAVQRYFVDQTAPPLDEFTHKAAVQLCFIQKHNSKFRLWANDLLKRLEENVPDQYQAVRDDFGEYDVAAPGSGVISGSGSHLEKSYEK